MDTLIPLSLPLDPAETRRLRLGDRVVLSGRIVVTAGLPTHHRLLQAIDQGLPVPAPMDGAAFFHLGSYSRPTVDGVEVLYMNPTTSTRFNPLMPRLIRHFGLRCVGGKGGLDGACAQALADTGGVYLSFLGGGCPLISQAIVRVVSAGWTDMISHYRLVTLEVDRLGPLTVAIDARGNSLYDRLAGAALEKRAEILTGLARERAADHRDSHDLPLTEGLKG